MQKKKNNIETSAKWIVMLSVAFPVTLTWVVWRSHCCVNYACWIIINKSSSRVLDTFELNLTCCVRCCLIWHTRKWTNCCRCALFQFITSRTTLQPFGSVESVSSNRLKISLYSIQFNQTLYEMVSLGFLTTLSCVCFWLREIKITFSFCSVYFKQIFFALSPHLAGLLRFGCELWTGMVLGSAN